MNSNELCESGKLSKRAGFSKVPKLLPNQIPICKMTLQTHLSRAVAMAVLFGKNVICKRKKSKKH